MKPLDLPPRPRILVVTLRRLGDALFATPLIASLRRAFPRSVIDVLVFEDTAGILAGNPDIDRIVTMPSRPSVWQGLVLALRLAKRYHLAVSTQAATGRPCSRSLRDNAMSGRSMTARGVRYGGSRCRAASRRSRDCIAWKTRCASQMPSVSRGSDISFVRVAFRFRIPPGVQRRIQRSKVRNPTPSSMQLRCLCISAGLRMAGGLWLPVFAPAA